MIKNKGLTTGKPVGVNKDNGLKFDFMRLLSRLVGIIGVFASLLVYVQVLPLIFIFSGAYMGISPEASMNNIDSVIWILTSVAFMILSIIGLVVWLKYLWVRYIVNARPVFKAFGRKTKTKN